MATTLDESVDGVAIAALARVERALVLLGQGRAELAERELRQALAVEPGDARAHAYLARCLVEQERNEEAQRSAESAVRLDPESAFAHCTLADVLWERGRAAEAIEEVMEAIGLDPFKPDYRAKLAEISFFGLNRPLDSLAAAEAGLALDPEHVWCGHLRAFALLELRRPAEAAVAAGAILRRAADDPMAHAIRGWALLDTKDRTGAEEHFRTALRLDPGSRWAQEGLRSSLRARYAGYRRPKLTWTRAVPEWELPAWKRGQVRWAGFWLAVLFAPVIAALAGVGILLWVAFRIARGTWRLTSDALAARQLRRDPLGEHLFPAPDPTVPYGVAACGVLALAMVDAAVAWKTDSVGHAVATMALVVIGLALLVQGWRTAR
jgi:tetratricopeptide (TPR) repeat protein